MDSISKRAATHAVLDHGDQYGSAYLPQGLGETNSAIVRLENADSLVNWIGRVGLMVRKDITQARAVAWLPGIRRFTGQRRFAGVGFQW